MEYDVGALPGEFEPNLVSDAGVGPSDQRFLSL
jgi:hypothetical protein